MELWIKRDDLSSFEMSGNKARSVRRSRWKTPTIVCQVTERLTFPSCSQSPCPSPSADGQVRKLEFLLADAISQSCDCVVTIGAPPRRSRHTNSLLSFAGGLSA